MQSIQVKFNPATQAIDPIDSASPEPWDAVCERFGNDVQRIMALSDRKDFSALYACYDENNQPRYYMVKEDETLMKLRKKTFLNKLGRP